LDARYIASGVSLMPLFVFVTPGHLFASSCMPPSAAPTCCAQGATLSEWADYLGCFASVSRIYAENSSLPAFRDALADAFAPGSRSFVGINYLRTALGQARAPIILVQIASAGNHLFPCKTGSHSASLRHTL
jgi:hypothetical protein